MELPLSIVAAWLLLAATVISVSYELWRATARAGVGPSDSMTDWLKGLPLYAGAVLVVALLLVGWEPAPLFGLGYGLLAVTLSTFWYGPRILSARRPGMLDWLEDRLFTMLMAVVTVLLLCDLLGISLVA